MFTLYSLSPVVLFPLKVQSRVSNFAVHHSDRGSKTTDVRVPALPPVPREWPVGEEATASFLSRCPSVRCPGDWCPSRFRNSDVTPAGGVIWDRASLGLKTSLQIGEGGSQGSGSWVQHRVLRELRRDACRPLRLSVGDHVPCVPTSTADVLSPTVDHVFTKWSGSACHLCALYSLEILWVFYLALPLWCDSHNSFFFPTNLRNTSFLKLFLKEYLIFKNAVHFADLQENHRAVVLIAVCFLL